LVAASYRAVGPEWLDPCSNAVGAGAVGLDWGDPMPPPTTRDAAARAWIARIFTIAEDIVYIGLGLLLAASAIALLIWGGIELAGQVTSRGFTSGVIGLLDHILLILLIVELLYTVQVSFREHTLVPEPFVLVGLIAAIRRVLVLTAEVGEMRQRTAPDFLNAMIELGVLTVLVVALTASLVLLRKRGPLEAHRA
jgi:uncharacterized membrane protein (DUF373 family)